MAIHNGICRPNLITINFMIRIFRASPPGYFVVTVTATPEVPTLPVVSVAVALSR